MGHQYGGCPFSFEAAKRIWFPCLSEAEYGVRIGAMNSFGWYQAWYRT